MQISIPLPDGKTRIDPLTVDANGYILHNGQRIKDSELRSDSPSKSYMVYLELKKVNRKVPALVNIFKNASKKNQNIVLPLYDQHMSIINLYTSEYEKADDKSRFQVRTYFYDEVKKLEPLIESIEKHIKHKPNTKFATALLKYFCMVSSMKNMIRDIRECPVPRCDDQGFVMEPISTTNRNYKKRRAVKDFLDSYVQNKKKLPTHQTVEKHLRKVLGQKWGVYRSGEQKLIEVLDSQKDAKAHVDKLIKGANNITQKVGPVTNQTKLIDFRIKPIETISARTYFEYKTEYKKGTIEWFFSTTDIVLVKKKM